MVQAASQILVYGRTHCWTCSLQHSGRRCPLDGHIQRQDPAGRALPLRERVEAWKKIFVDVMTEAPWIPVFNERRVVAKSKRMGGEPNIYVDPTRVINYDAIFVKP